jgi:hypothetical protein
MLTFNELRESLLISEDKTVKKFVVRSGGEKVDVEVVKTKGNKFVAIVNGERLGSTHSSGAAAEKDAKDFIKLLGG